MAKCIQIIICIMNQEVNSGSSQDLEPRENQFEPSSNEEQVAGDHQAHPGLPQSIHQPKQPQKDPLPQQKNQMQKESQLAAAPAEGNFEDQSKEKPKPSKDQAIKSQASIKIRKKLKKSRSASSFSGDSFNSKQIKSRKRKNKKTSAELPKTTAQTIPRPQGKQRGRQKPTLTKAPEVKQSKQAIEQATSKANQKMSQKGIASNRRVVEQNKGEAALINMNWFNEKPGEEDLNSVDAQMCEQSQNQRQNSFTTKKIVEFLNSQSENIVRRIAELPIVFY